MRRYHSEAESAEKESDSVCFIVGFRIGEVSIGVCEFFADIFSGSFLGFSCFQNIILKILEIEFSDNESSRDDVILVNILNESLNSSFFDELFLVDSSFNIYRVAGDTDEQKM